MSLRFAEPAAAAYAYPLLVRHLLHAPMAAARDQEIVYRDRRLTYAEVERRIHRLAGALRKLGVNEGTTVAVMDWDNHRYLECYFAVPMMGAVLQTVNVRLSPDQIAWTIAHAGAEVLLMHRDFAELIGPMLATLPRLRAIVLLDEPGMQLDPPGFCTDEYERMLADSTDRYPFQDFDENALATTFYTTGTTGDPKAVCFSHRQIVLHALALMAALGSAGAQSFQHDDVYMPITPMFHVQAWGLPYVATLMGVKQVYPGRYEPERLLALRRREGVTFSHCVPTILKMLLEASDARQTDLRGWKLAMGGSALPRQLAADALARGIEIFSGYGMSETGPVLTINRIRAQDLGRGIDHELAIRCSSGLPIPLVNLRIVDPCMNDVPHDGKASGEIVVRAPWLTPCYVGNRSASEQLWKDGFLHTQDVATIDADGHLRIRDRLKDLIKTGGEWLSSLLLEDLLVRHAAVLEAAVVAIPDEKWGERPLAFVALKPDMLTSVDAGQIREHMASFAASGQIPRYAVPEQIVFVDALAKTSVGKIDKKAMRQRLAGLA